MLRWSPTVELVTSTVIVQLVDAPTVPPVKVIVPAPSLAVNVPEQPSTGLGTQLRNVGEISNQGIEIEANILILNTDKVRWDLGLTYHTVDNEVTSLGDAAPFNLTGQQRVDVDVRERRRSGGFPLIRGCFRAFLRANGGCQTAKNEQE